MRARLVAGSTAIAVALGCAVAAAPAERVEQLREAVLVRSSAGVPPTAAGTQVTLPHKWGPAETKVGGDAWYLLHWDVATPRSAQSLRLSAVTMAAEVWMNGEVIARTGPLDGRPPRSHEQSLLDTIPEDVLRPGVNRIAVRVKVRPGTYAGLAPVEVGDSEALSRRALRDLIVHTLAPAAVGVATLAGGVLILGLWARRRDPAYGLFGLAAVLWGAHTLVSLLPEAPLPPPHWFVTWHAVYMLFVGLLCLFMVRFAEADWRTYRRVVVAFVLAVAPLLYAAHALGVAAPAATVVRATGILLVFAALYAVVRRAARSLDAENLMLLATGALSAVFAVHDWMAANSTEVRPVWLVPYAALAFLMLVGWILTDRFVRALNASERANLDLAARVDEKSAALGRQLEATREARDTAEAASASKSRFLAAASHDLRQPLHAIGLFTAALAEQTTNTEQAALVQRIARSIDSLEALFAALLDISKLDAGVVAAQPVDLAVDPLLDRLAQEFAPEALRKGLKLAVVPTRAVVRSDPMLLERIVRNLMSNALRYTEGGGVVVGCRPRGSGFALEVWDSGPGIALADRDRIFEEFYQAGSRELDRAGGLGLGLAIVRRLAELLGHRLELASTPGHGSVFRVLLPRGDRACVAVPAAPPVAQPQVLAGCRILVVEDESPVRAGTEGLLRSWGCVPLCAADAQSAVELAAQGAPPDAAIVDFRLRVGSDGLAALDAIALRLGHRVPALIVSGESHADELARIESSGFLLLHKPVAPARLHAALAWVVSQAPARAA